MKIVYLILSFSLVVSVYGCAQNANPLKSVSSEQFKKIVDSNEAVLVDVRSELEYSAGHIPGAVNIDVNSPDFEIQIREASGGKPLAIYCRSGRRSKSAVGRLKNVGVEVYELNNGFVEWLQKGFPVKK